MSKGIQVLFNPSYSAKLSPSEFMMLTERYKNHVYALLECRSFITLEWSFVGHVMKPPSVQWSDITRDELHFIHSVFSELDSTTMPTWECIELFASSISAGF